jgi:hypothetical protein
VISVENLTCLACVREITSIEILTMLSQQTVCRLDSPISDWAEDPNAVELNGTKALQDTEEKTVEFTIECDVNNGPIYLHI